MEIVSEPDMRSAEEAISGQVRTILRYLGVSTGDMEKGAMRFEANLAAHPRAGGAGEYGTKVEVKNLNSFKADRTRLPRDRAAECGAGGGGGVEQVTMGWDEERGATVLQRSKESSRTTATSPSRTCRRWS